LSFQLRNEYDQTLSITLSNRAWYCLLELAEQHGWNPMGTVRPDWLAGLNRAEPAEPESDLFQQGSYTPQVSRQVVLEDALNFADALDRPSWCWSRIPRCCTGESTIPSGMKMG
jgi:hypothetical protein